MANTYQDIPFSGSSGTFSEIIVPNSGSNTIIHTGTATANVVDHIYLYCSNVYGSDLALSLKVGTSSFNRSTLIKYGVGQIPIFEGTLCLNGGTILYFVPISGSGSLILDGWVRRVVTA